MPYNSKNWDQFVEDVLKKYKDEMFNDAGVKPENLYKESLVNCKTYSPKIATYIFPALFDNIEEAEREKGYKVDSHYHSDGEVLINQITNRQEEVIAKIMATKKKIGGMKIIDYQVPIKNERTESTKGQGKVDLLGIDIDSDNIYLIELKKPGSTESFLRAYLEVATYCKLINKDRLINSYKELQEKRNIIPAIMIFKDSQPYEDIKYSQEIKELVKRFENTSLYPQVFIVDIKALELRTTEVYANGKICQKMVWKKENRINIKSLNLKNIN